MPLSFPWSSLVLITLIDFTYHVTKYFSIDYKYTFVLPLKVHSLFDYRYCTYRIRSDVWTLVTESHNKLACAAMGPAAEHAPPAGQQSPARSPGAAYLALLLGAPDAAGRAAVALVPQRVRRVQRVRLAVQKTSRPPARVTHLVHINST